MLFYVQHHRQKLARELLKKMGRWWLDLPNFSNITSIDDLILGSAMNSWPNFEFTKFEVVIRAFLWCLQSYINGLCFNGKVKSILILEEEVKSLSFHQIRYRGKSYKFLKWEDWMQLWVLLLFSQLLASLVFMYKSLAVQKNKISYLSSLGFVHVLQSQTPMIVLLTNEISRSSRQNNKL